MIRWRHIRTGNVISNMDYRNLPLEVQSLYLRISDEEDDDEEDSGSGLLSTVVGAVFESLLDSPSIDTSSSDSGSSSNDFGGFGDGDGGGGGASGDW